MQAPLPNPPQVRQEWQQLKNTKLAADSEYLDLTWDEYDNDYQEYRVHASLAAVGDTSGATYPTHVGVRLRLKNTTTGAVAWHSGSYYSMVIDDTSASADLIGFSTGGYAYAGNQGRATYTPTPTYWAGYSMLDLWLPGQEQSQPNVEIRSSVAKNGPFVFTSSGGGPTIAGEPGSNTGSFNAYLNNYPWTILYRITGIRLKLSKYPALTDTKYHKSGSIAIVYGHRYP